MSHSLQLPQESKFSVGLSDTWSKCCRPVQWFSRIVIPYVSDFIVKYRDPILKIATILGVIAAVSAFFLKGAFIITLVISSTLLFCLAAWTYRRMEKQISKELGDEKDALLRGVELGRENLASEQEIRKSLEARNLELVDLNAKQGTEISALHEVQSRQEAQLREQSAMIQRLESESRTIQSINLSLRAMFPGYFQQSELSSQGKFG